MVTRLFCTGAALGLSAFGFFANPEAVTPFSPFGIVFLAVSGVIWLGWEAIRASYAYRDEISPNSGHAFLQAERLGPLTVDRLVRRDGR